MARLRLVAVWMLAAGCARCGKPAERPVASRQPDAGGLVQPIVRPPVPDAGPPAPYVRKAKKLAPLPRQARVEQIFIGDNLSHMPWNPPRARKRSRAEAKATAEKLVGELRRGADFDALAKKDSDWPMAGQNGGALGVVTEGVVGMMPIVDPKVFSMAAGEITEPFESSIGFHVLKKLPMLRLAHILIAVRDGKRGAPARSLDEARAIAHQAEEQIKGGATFEAVAFDLSDDLTSAGRGGDLGGVDEHSAFAPEVRSAAEALQPGEISAPIDGPAGVEIVKRLE